MVGYTSSLVFIPEMDWIGVFYLDLEAAVYAHHWLLNFPTVFKPVDLSRKRTPPSPPVHSLVQVLVQGEGPSTEDFSR